MSNRLKFEHSPYLLEHAENPVNWFPWCEEAFETARREDRPVFLSIGYSTCHWCHVMAKESFEDEQVAEILNRAYVSVKLDREERPDIDSVYVSVCTALTGSAGWPLTVIMTPDGRPFFAGTYIPKNDGAGRAGLISLLRFIEDKWQHSRAELLKTGRDITEYLSREREHSAADIGREQLELAAKQFADTYDKEYGGFGPAPKFPSPQNLLFLLRYAHFSGDRAARASAEHTLQQMYRGGIFDHFGGGFSRYSTDREWLAPHFEKTLYDNALLAAIYTEAWEDGHYALYRDVAERTLDYCLRELHSPEGGFFCGQDADSDGIEGGYYVFIPAEIRQVLGEDDGRHFCECYDITDEGNFGGSSIPNLLLNNRWTLVPEGYAAFRGKLREYRAARMPLKTDTKQLLSWNALMLTALSKAYLAFGDRRYLTAAQELAAFLDTFGPAEALCAQSVSGKGAGQAMLDGYCFYAIGLTELYKADFDARHIEKAAALARAVLTRFSDGKGGFYDTAEDSERLIIRPQTVFDGAMPSCNSACAVMLDRLSRLTGELRFKAAREKLLAFIGGCCGKYPAGCAYALTAAMSDIWPTRELVCASADGEAPSMLFAVTEKYAPELTVLLKTPENAELLARISPFTAQMQPSGGKAMFYVCSGGECSLPISES